MKHVIDYPALVLQHSVHALGGSGPAADKPGEHAGPQRDAFNAFIGDHCNDAIEWRGGGVPKHRMYKFMKYVYMQKARSETHTMRKTFAYTYGTRKKEFCNMDLIPEAPHCYSFRCDDDTGVSYMLYGDTWRVGVGCAGVPGC